VGDNSNIKLCKLDMCLLLNIAVVKIGIEIQTIFF
jgi:hypothetical protein